MIHHGDDIARFVSEKLGMALCPPYAAFGLKREDGEIHAGIILNCFEGADVHLTAAGKGWTRSFLQGIGRYVYQQLDCERMTIITEQPDVVALALRLGGKVEGCLRSHFGPGRNATIIGVLRSEWRWITV